MTLDNDDALAKVLGVPTLENLPKAKYPDVAVLLPEMSDELRLKLFELIPGFLQFSLDAMSAVEETLQKTLASSEKDQAELSASFRELQAIARGRLERDSIHRATCLDPVSDETSACTSVIRIV